MEGREREGQRLRMIDRQDAPALRGVTASPHCSPSASLAACCHRVEFKLDVLVFKALHGLARQYLADDCQLLTAAGRRQLRSSDAIMCVVQHTRTRLGDRSFAVAGPRPSVQQSIPAELRHPNVSLG